MRRTGYTRDGRTVRANFHGNPPRLTSYRIESGPLIRATDFTCPADIYDALRRAIRTTPRPKGLPR